MTHPREVLRDAQAASGGLTVCDHYCGVEERIVKSLALQRELVAEAGHTVFDVTMDCEDGAPSGREAEHAHMVVELARQAVQADPRARVATRVHPVDHPAFAQDVQTLVQGAGHVWCHMMIPKVESVADIDLAVRAIDQAAEGGKVARMGKIPVQALIESAHAVHHAHAIAAHPRVQSLSFGLMDFVSAHGGAIPASALGVRSEGSALGQFDHPLVRRAKLEISSACHAAGKVPSHSVITEFKDMAAMKAAALRATHEFGYTRMWSIHPSQIRPILEALSPSAGEIEEATELLQAAQAVDWAPISFGGRLHDRASYRYYWQVLERAHRTGRDLPAAAAAYFAGA
jgi:citrate lyase subunit beta/citryl-CoA lyase